MAKAKRPTQAELPQAVKDAITADIAAWRAGLWAESVAYGPACTCGLRAAKGECFRHEAEAEMDPAAGG